MEKIKDLNLYWWIDDEYEFLSSFLSNPVRAWEVMLNKGDKRTSEWILCGGLTPVILLIAAYLAIVILGMKWMKHREPYNLKWMIFLYNICLVGLNGHILYELISCSWRLKFNYWCTPVRHNSYHADELRIARAIWWWVWAIIITLV